MRLFLIRSASTFAVALMVTAVSAQTEPKPLPAPQMNNVILSRPFLMDPKVQQELGLTEKQVAQLQQLAKSAMRANQNALNGLESEGEDGFDFNTMMGSLDRSARQQHAATGKLLTSAQKTRINEIELQREGWPALGRPDVAAKVKLSKVQFKKIQQIIGDMRLAQTNSLFQSPQGPNGPTLNSQSPVMKNLSPSNGFLDMSGTFAPETGPLAFAKQDTTLTNEKSAEASGKIQSDSAEKVAALLTPEQKSTFEAMIGAPFNFEMLNQPAPAPAPAPSSLETPAGTVKPAPKKPARR